MEYVIQLLEKEKKIIETQVREEELMYKNKRQATLYLKNISAIKRALKVLRTKTRILNYTKQR